MIQTDYETWRRELLACLYNRNFRKAEKLVERIVALMERQPDLSEADQKALNQIWHSLKHFEDAIMAGGGRRLSAYIRRLRQNMVGVVREQTRRAGSIDYEQWRETIGLNGNTLETLFKTTACLQLTIGCGNFCRRCNEWALPGVRKHFTLDAAQKIIEHLFQCGNDQFVLYSASDPLNWRDGSRDITAILDFMEARGFQPRYGLLTKAPRGTQNIMRALIARKADMAVSVTAKNRAKIRRIEKQAHKRLALQHDYDELLIASGLDEDLATIKSSITDNYGVEITPEGAFLIIPTFTSALNLTGQARLPVSSQTELFLPLKTGREALTVEYFKPFRALDPQGREFFLETLLKPQVENILLDNGAESVTPPGMMNLREYFSIYQPEAVMRRKRMVRPVIKKLQQQILLPRAADADQRRQDRIRFKQKARDYLAFCQMELVIEFKRNALSFYLQAASAFLQRYSVEQEIIKHLRKEDRDRSEKRYGDRFNARDRDVESFLMESMHDTFERFQFLVLRLVENPGMTPVQRFIRANPSQYDPARDRFVRA